MLSKPFFFFGGSEVLFIVLAVLKSGPFLILGY